MPTNQTPESHCGCVRIECATCLGTGWWYGKSGSGNCADCGGTVSRRGTGHTIDATACRWPAVAQEAEQLRVQLAGCGVAALGGTGDPAKQGDYGWSASYQDVLELRRKHDAVAQGIERIRGLLDEALRMEDSSSDVCDPIYLEWRAYRRAYEKALSALCVSEEELRT